MATLQMSEQQSTTQTPQPPPRASLAFAADPERALHLAPNFQPDVDLVMAEGVIAFGVKGSGNRLSLEGKQEKGCTHIVGKPRRSSPER